MKQDTKKILIGGGALVALYFLLQPTGEDGGLGGGGGMPLLPGIPEAAPEEISAAAPVIYNFPEMAQEPFEKIDWGIKPDVEAPPKKLDLTEYDPRTPGFTLGKTPVIPTPYSVKGAEMYAAGELPSITKKSVSDKPYKPDRPVQFSEASIGGFFDYLAPLTQLGKGARGRDIASRDVDKAKIAAITTKKMEQQRISTSVGEYGPRSIGVTYGKGGRSYNVPGVSYGKTGITYSRPAGPPAPSKKQRPGSPD